MAEQHHDVRAIKLNGNTFVTIEQHTAGLRLSTHKETIVEHDGTTLVIRDPPSFVIGSSSSSSIYVGTGGRMMIQNYNGTGTIIMDNGSMFINNGSAATREECNTEHLIQCTYDNLSLLVCGGAMHVTVDVPLSIDSKIDVNGAGAITLIGRQRFDRLLLDVSGAGSISANASSIGSLCGRVTGSGKTQITGGDNDAPLSVDSAQLVVTGSGCTQMGGATIGTATCCITGSGKIVDFTIITSGACVPTGSGSINCNARHTANVTETKTGSGKFKITRC